jgi:beta-lactamase superfamily II metal-dependent hydrolase
LPPWSPGTLDIHHLNTGRGNATYFVFPDGTTLLLDAGDAGDRVPGADPAPDGSRSAGGWIVRYLAAMAPEGSEPRLDYAVLTHFHSDHMGYPGPDAPRSKRGDFGLSGITEVAEHIPIAVLLDRGFPDYAYPAPARGAGMEGYRAFVARRGERGELTERFRPGRADQITLRHRPEAYADFEIRNLAANGEVWSGRGEETEERFPPLAEPAEDERPSENQCSLALHLRYGAFDYFTSGDLPGVPDDGAPEWMDMEAPLARVLGPVEVHVVGHHGSIDPASPELLAALRPRVHILPTWAPSHPAPVVVKRLLNPRIYPGPRDLFATYLRDPTALVIGPRAERLASRKGHVVVRVPPGGESFEVVVLEEEGLTVRSVHGPYPAHPRGPRTVAEGERAGGSN